ncbi:Uncharacterized conserved protein YidB, DUF937 family [Andreprevotia lacus DSM 23236]|jgi:uncharacterized protein YidB (DUF937 family)|uniref:Uncharacterized conserved protein YidB, DUF937 family n=2 Tax=Andreprevotia TaxID=397275 RepID=A0A1W1XRB4_9NEIS|nr:YidB family protein [Andreprevotia lacus]SMC26529.1 Uncharacterized conserved protein YidB, DUF937 family [Andreprevotia lacus DSM 23236]
MSLLDQLGGLLGQDNGQQGMLGAVSQLVEQHGGLGGLVNAFQQGGLGELVQSWVSTGQNLPVSADQLQGVLGSDALAGIAQKLGVDPQQAASQLSGVLPQLVDQLTPNGTLPTEGGDVNELLGGLKNLFG